MPFHFNENVYATRDDRGAVRSLQHRRQPFVSDTGLAASNPRNLGEAYLRSVASIHGFSPDLISNIYGSISPVPTDDGVRILFANEKNKHIVTVISYVQTVLGLAIWESGFSVSILPDPLRGTSSISKVRVNVEVKKPSANARCLNEIGSSLLRELLCIEDKETDLTVNSQRLLVYQYDSSRRQKGGHRVGLSSTSAAVDGDGVTLPLPDVPKDIKSGTYYVAREVLFTWPIPPFGKVHWRAFFEVEEGSVLYLRAFLSGAKGYVYLQDPVTAINGPMPTATDADLDPLRTLVVLPGISPSNPQALFGDYVKVGELSPPVNPPPTEASGNFLFHVHEDGFAATNAYYHVESLFRLMVDLGFDNGKLFAHTAINPGFPLTVDQSSINDTFGAFSLGNSTLTGSGGIIFGRAGDNSTVGIANDFRVVAHEFCHALLFEAVGSPNFAFCHSAGDSIGAILSDPGSEAPDRYLTFPWIVDVPRRHDGDVTKGWAWGGTMDDRQYGSEQILSTLLFRAYLSIGGGASVDGFPTWLETRTWASRYLVYLIVAGIASLASVQTTPTAKPEDYAAAMMHSDDAILGFDKTPGGGVAKVIRWSFEKQGAYQPAGATRPIKSAGAPPNVDVYIDDGRHGEYQYQFVYWETTDIWNRHTPDGALDHQTPFVNVPNYGYVRIKNRGTKTATNVVVSGYHVRPSSGLVWPDTYQPMTTASVPVPDIPSGGEAIAGPFQWTPTQLGHECMLMSVSALGDLSNIDPATLLPCAKGPLPDWRLVPFDNNIAQRNVAPVPGGGGLNGLAAGLNGKTFWANNPYDYVARLALDITIPAFLEKGGWRVTARSEDTGEVFTLAPRTGKKITLTVHPGQDFSAGDVHSGDAMIRVRTLIDGIIVGGMSYFVDPTLKKPAPEHPPCRHHHHHHRHHHCNDSDDDTDDDWCCLGRGKKEAECLLKSLGINGDVADCVEKVEISRVTVDIDLRKKDYC
ncbi:MAG: hypothetical protein M1839_005775 [Geoglossum umbratile]|nr:MAG: hypothetical protein M1839_005775 [Geoglossum umbratile]